MLADSFHEILWKKASCARTVNATHQFLFRITGGVQIARDAVGMTLLFRRL
jgi:hypothetical protein